MIIFFVINSIFCDMDLEFCFLLIKCATQEWYMSGMPPNVVCV